MPSSARAVAHRRALAVLGVITAVPAVATAQHGRPRPVIEPPVEYARVLPETCLALPDWADHLRWEGQGDTARYTPERDRLAPEAAAAVARCLATADTTSAQPWQWLALARLALAVGQDAAARRWHERYLAPLARAPLPRRAWAQHLVVLSYADAHPPRLAAAQAALRALDALGPPAARVRVLAHGRLVEAARRQWQDPLGVRAAAACLGAYRELPPAWRDPLSGAAAACALGQAEVALRHQDRARALAGLDSGLAALPRGSSGWQRLQRWRTRYALVGTPAPVIAATRWFRREGSEPKPARGVVTLLHAVDHADGSATQYRALRRLAARFAGRPFELIAYAKTQGFFGDSGAPMPPEREIGLDSAYFYGYAQLPGALAVYATRFTIEADGRRREQPTPHEQHYSEAGLVLIDTRGLVRYVGDGIDGPTEELLARLIAALLAAP